MIELWVIKIDGNTDYHLLTFLWQVDVKLRQYPKGVVQAYHWHQANTGCHGSSVIGAH